MVRDFNASRMDADAAQWTLHVDIPSYLCSLSIDDGAFRRPR